MARLGTRVLNKRLLESLARAGAHSTGWPNRRRLFEAADVLLRYGAACGARRPKADQVSLFGGSGAAQVPQPTLPAVEDWPALERLQMEFDVLGPLSLGAPARRLPRALVRLGVTHRRPAAAGRGRGRPAAAGRRDRQQAGAGDRAHAAVRLIVSDHTAQFEVTAFSELMGQARELLDGTAPLYFEADARVDGDNLRLTAQRIQKLDEVADLARAAVEIRLAAPNVALRLKSMLQRQSANGARVRLVVPVAGRRGSDPGAARGFRPGQRPAPRRGAPGGRAGGAGRGAAELKARSPRRLACRPCSATLAALVRPAAISGVSVTTSRIWAVVRLGSCTTVWAWTSARA